MHETQTVLADVRGVRLSVMRLKSAAARAVYAVCAGSFGTAFAKCPLSLVTPGS